MSIVDSFKRLLPHELRQHLKRSLFVHQDMSSRLLNLRRAGFLPKGAIDCGAYQGDWTRDFWKVWPGVPVLLIEPQPGCQKQLTDLAAKVRFSSVGSCALGDSCGMASFALGETNSGIRTAGLKSEGESIEVPLRTLDSLLGEKMNFSPDFLKLDLQGFELHALRGAKHCMPNFEVILLEISIIRIGDVPVFREVDCFMEEQGYKIYDLIPQYYRPLDGALWQIDAFYVREGSPLISSREWQ